GIARHHPRHRQRALAWPQHPALVNVVAEVKHEIELLLGNAPVGGEEAVLIFLAAREAEPDLRNRCTGGRQRARAPDAAALRADRELVEVIARGLEPAHLDMDGMAELRMSDRRALLGDLAHARIAGDRPFDLDRTFGHAAAVLCRLPGVL